MRKYEGIKKVDLNCHIDGSLDIMLASKWLKISIEDAKEKLTRTQGVKNLKDYLEKFQLPISLLQVKTHLKEASYLLAESLKEENVIYAECIIAPLSHLEKGLTIEEVVENVLAGFSMSGLDVRLILALKREDSIKENKKVISIAKKYLKKGVCGVGLYGDESLFPTSTFLELFNYAKDANVPFTINAGENGTFKDIDYAIKFGALRIGTGVEAIKSFDTMQALKKNSIPIEICLSTNLDIKLFNKISEHPVGRLRDSGVPVIICSGNRTISKTDLSHEYYLLAKYFGFTNDDFKKLNIEAIKHAFISDEEKEELLKKL